jgi:putative flippase GtrA
MSMLRQGRDYVLVGILQWLLDWSVMVGLTHAGMPIEPANILGRISGALLGFWLNGRITFASDHHRMGRRQFVRFLTMWLATTAVSTWAMSSIYDMFGLQWAWVAKPAVEIALSVIGFLLSRHWIYKH